MEDKIKKCCRCQQEKPFVDFNKCKSGKMGLHGHCRACQKEVKAAWDSKNKDWIKEYYSQEEVKEASRKNQLERYRNDEEYRKKTLEKNKIRRRGEEAKIKQRANEKLRREINPSYRLRANLNARLKQICHAIKQNKTDSVIKLIGCSMNDFRLHLESQFKEGMSWDNYGNGEGKWCMDHIIPCCAFDLTKEEEQLKCYHYTNVQPLWWEENLSKGAKLENGVDARIYHQTKNYQKINNQEMK